MMGKKKQKEKKRKKRKLLKCLRTTYIDKFTSNEFENYYLNHIIKQEKTVPSFPQHKGMVDSSYIVSHTI